MMAPSSDNDRKFAHQREQLPNSAASFIKGVKKEDPGCRARRMQTVTNCLASFFNSSNF